MVIRDIRSLYANIKHNEELLDLEKCFINKTIKAL